jgi:hypothetical protein
MNLSKALEKHECMHYSFELEHLSFHELAHFPDLHSSPLKKNKCLSATFQKEICATSRLLPTVFTVFNRFQKRLGIQKLLVLSD